MTWAGNIRKLQTVGSRRGPAAGGGEVKVKTVALWPRAPLSITSLMGETREKFPFFIPVHRWWSLKRRSGVIDTESRGASSLNRYTSR